jgi:hypothetical protein
VDVITELGFGPPTVDLINVEPFDLGPPEIAGQKVHRQLYVAPDSEHDLRRGEAIA